MKQINQINLTIETISIEGNWPRDPLQVQIA